MKSMIDEAHIPTRVDKSVSLNWKFPTFCFFCWNFFVIRRCLFVLLITHVACQFEHFRCRPIIFTDLTDRGGSQYRLSNGFFSFTRSVDLLSFAAGSSQFVIQEV